jgi:23S rRNA pseudouridine1911/1915/1917 synthase
MEPTILFENDDVLVVSKPAGLLVHEDDESVAADTVVGWALRLYPTMQGVGEPGKSPKGKVLERSGVVHRLDRDTSGIMILAKTSAAYDHLKLQFSERRVYKEYRAFVYGRVHDRWGTIDRPIGRSVKDFRLRSAQKGAKGLLRPAVTDYERIGVGEYENESFSYIKLIPKTGRTHQLRVHLKAIDRPIVGDRLYAPTFVERSNNLDLTRLALHAHVLEVILPHGESERFVSPVPQVFEEAAERIAE